MPVPVKRDRDLARARLSEWFQAKLGDASDPWVSEIGGPDATGFSNETLMFDVRWSQGGEKRERSFVARVKPKEYSVFLDPAFEDQYRVMKSLEENTRIPLPGIYWYEGDDSVLGSPFYVMERVDGQIPGDIPPLTVTGWVLDASPQDQSCLWWSGIEAMAMVHRTDWRALGLEFLEKPEFGDPGFDQQLGYYRASLEWASQGRPQPVAEAALQWLVDNRPGHDGPVCLLWGDSRPANMIFRDYRCVAVLDWEMVTLGPPEIDLAWWLFLDRHWTEGIGVPPLPGFPSRPETIARYEELLGRPMLNLEYYEVFCGLRFAVIMMRIAQMAIAYQMVPADSDMETNNIPTQLLAKILELPPPGPPISFTS